LATLYPAYTPTPTRAAFFNLLFNFDFGLGGLPELEPEGRFFGLKAFVILVFNELPEPLELELGLEPLELELGLELELPPFLFLA